ncbi:MAG: polysaccharide deacetylase family protein [Mycobacterium sp.]
MPEVTRRQFVAGLLTTAGLVAVSRTIGLSDEAPHSKAPHASSDSARLLPAPPRTQRVSLPGSGALSRLPGDGDMLALTLDDGVSPEVVRCYTQLAKDTGIRLTYFVNGVYDSWRENARLLRPLVDSGQIQLGNHTWSHSDLTMLDKGQVADELQRNHRFLRDTYGVDAAPYFRPPYGNSNQTVDAVAADLGYQVKTLWSASLADSTVLPEDYIVEMADQHFIQQNIVVGHLNHPPVTRVYPQMLSIIGSRDLRTVTLNDVFLQAEVPRVVGA